MISHLTTEKRIRKLAITGATFVDVRNPVAFRDGTMKNALNMSLRQLSQLQTYDKAKPIVLIGDEDHATLSAAENYVKLYGFNQVYSILYTPALSK